MSDRRPRASSFDSEDLSQLPRFTKSATMSTTDSADSQASRFSSGLRVTHATPSARTHRESVEVAPGEFSKPRVAKRSRRGTNSSARSSKSEGAEKPEFKYYGRHGNQWLFNDFSVTDAVSKGFKKVFGKEGESGDWYENRGR
ncbi:hypothetical protein IQ07DRAFT_645434 [Pyrenochaeta sp. DS3sAY3a]|nr:hypothetical protein IQ07DRAFT_645434 [Pyrenochaeta sp. DS3sAY3a]